MCRYYLGLRWEHSRGLASMNGPRKPGEGGDNPCLSYGLCREEVTAFQELRDVLRLKEKDRWVGDVRSMVKHMEEVTRARSTLETGLSQALCGSC